VEYKKGIKQEDNFGCGVACVATLLGLSYQQTIRLFSRGRIQAKQKGFTCRELVKALNNCGKNYYYRYISSKIKPKIYQDKTIVFIKRSTLYPNGHYFCRINSLWMDPWINFRESKSITEARAGFRKRLPGKPIYAIFSVFV
jgi:hypothetical protein